MPQEEVETEEIETPPDEQTVETPPAEEPEAPEAEPVADDDGEEPNVPTIIEHYHPELVQFWNELDEPKQRAILSGLARAIDRGEPDGEPAGGQPNGQGQEPPQPPATSAASAAPPASYQPWEGVTEEELNEVAELADESVARVLRKLAQGVALANSNGATLAGLVVKANDETRASLTSWEDEREFEKALDAHARDLQPLNRREYFEVVEKAKAYKSGNRTKDFHDAIDLALLHHKQIVTTGKPAPPSKLRRDAERLAASLATRTKGGKGRLSIPAERRTVRNVFDELARRNP